MTDPVTCPNCRDQLDVPVEFRGRSVKCATCQTVFAVPVQPLGEPPLARPSRGRPREEYDADRPPRKRTNGVVWFLLAGTLLIAGGMSALCAGVTIWMCNPPMQVHKSEEGKFQVEFPDKPVPFSQPGEKGVPVKGVEARREEVGQMRFFVKYYDLPKMPKAIKDSDTEAILTDALRAEIAQLAAGTELQREAKTHAGFPCIDVHLEQGNQIMKRGTVVRIILAGSRIYILGAQGQSLVPELWYVQRFFISFQPNEKPKPVKKPEE